MPTTLLLDRDEVSPSFFSGSIPTFVAIRPVSSLMSGLLLSFAVIDWSRACYRLRRSSACRRCCWRCRLPTTASTSERKQRGVSLRLTVLRPGTRAGAGSRRHRRFGRSRRLLGLAGSSRALPTSVAEMEVTRSMTWLFVSTSLLRVSTIPVPASAEPLVPRVGCRCRRETKVHALCDRQGVRRRSCRARAVGSPIPVTPGLSSGLPLA